MTSMVLSRQGPSLPLWYVAMALKNYLSHDIPIYLTGTGHGHLSNQGPTGSGKTSLLNALAGRVKDSKGAKLTGEMKVNNKPRKESEFKRLAAYVQQDDVLVR